MMICISGREPYIEKQEYMKVFVPRNQPLSCSMRQKKQLKEERTCTYLPCSK